MSLTTFTVHLDDTEVEVFLEYMRACGHSTPNSALRGALFTQCRLSDVEMPPGCFGRWKRPAAPAPTVAAPVAAVPAVPPDPDPDPGPVADRSLRPPQGLPLGSVAAAHPPGAPPAPSGP
jgi:hypothetical protein